LIEKRKLLAKEKTVLRVVCTLSKSVSAYAKLLPHVLGGTSFDDLRLSGRYLTDLDLTTCGWNECEVEPTRIEGLIADEKCLAKSPPSGVSPRGPPKLRFLAFAVLLVGQKGSASPQRDPIRALAVATNSGEVSVLTPLGDNDARLLSSFTQVVHEFNPDVIVGYETNKLQWPCLIQRAKINRVKLTLGRDQSEPHTSVFGHLSIAGRANVDLADLASGIVDIKVKDLKNLAAHFGVAIGDRLTVRDDWERLAVWSDPPRRQELLKDTEVSARTSLELAQEAIDYPVQLSAITKFDPKTWTPNITWRTR
jgi:DNA polymerase I